MIDSSNSNLRVRIRDGLELLGVGGIMSYPEISRHFINLNKSVLFMMYYQRRVTEMEKLKLLLEFKNGSQSIAEFTKSHRIHKRTFYDWLKKFEISSKSATFAPRIGIKADLNKPMKEKSRAELETELAQVKKDLEWAKLQNLALNTMIDIAEEQGIQIRKKSGAKQ